MPKDRKFVNPLTRPSEQGEPTSTNTSTSTSTYTSTDTQEERQPSEGKVRRKEQTFEEINERLTAWVNKDLKRNFEALIQRKHGTKSAMLNEAIADLLEKYKNT